MVENKLRQLIIIGNCGFHVRHDLIKPNVGSTDWNIKKVLQSAFQILRDCSARLKEYENVSGSNGYQLCFFITRFLFPSQTEILCRRRNFSDNI